MVLAISASGSTFVKVSNDITDLKQDELDTSDLSLVLLVVEYSYTALSFLLF